MRQNLFFIYYKFNQKIFPKINFILGNNTVEPKGVKSNFFGADLSKLNKLNTNSLTISNC